MNILVTGGAGFIGSNFIYYELESHPENKIICLDKLTYAGNINNLAEAVKHTNFRFVKGDIADKECVEQLFEEEAPDIVVNFAAESHVDRSIEEPMEFVRTNVLGTQVLLDACRKYGIKRFHQISTDEVYGDLPLDVENAFTEQMLLKPSSPYSASKASADLLVMSYFRTFGLPVTISRCSNNYGPYQHREKFIPLIITNLLNNKNIPVYGTGRNVRDWIYVLDHCRAVDLIISNGRDGEIYNVGGGNEWSNIDIAYLLLGLMGKGTEFVEFVQDRPGHDLRYAVNSDKICSELGWHPEMSFEKGIADTINWYSEREIEGN